MMTRKLIGFSTAAVLAAAVAFYGCGGGGGSSSAPATTAVTTNAQASSVGATGASTATVSANMGQTLSNVASPSPTGAPKFKSALAGKDPRFAKFNQALATAMKAPRTKAAAIMKAQSFRAAAPLYIIDCSLGTQTTATDNIMSISAGTTTSSYSITFTNCKMDTTRLNGTITETFSLSGQTISFTTTLGDSDGTVTSADFKTEFFETAIDTTAYATLTIDLSETGTENNSTTPPTYSFAANGKMKYDEGANSYTMSLTNVTFAYSKDATTGKMTTTSNGAFGETWTEAGTSKITSITFESFVTTETPATDYSYTLYTANGKVTVDNTGFCADGDGVWEIVTNTDIKEMTATGEIVAGKMTINTTTVVEFQSDGSVIVTASGGTPTTVTKADFDTIESSCAIADLNPAPSGGGTTGSVPAAPTSPAAACGNQKITVSWTAATGATSYNVYRATSAGATGTLAGNSSTTSYVDTSGTVGATYYYTVKAVNSTGESTASSEVSETFYKVLAGAMQGKSLSLTGNVTTFAGLSGSSGSTDGVGSAARFNLPQGMTSDGTYLYVADYANNVIRKIDPATQTVTLFAGSPTYTIGHADGSGTAAIFYRPYDITNDGTSLYVTESTGSCLIRKIDIATANVTTLAGQYGTCSPYTAGTGTGAILASPRGITTDGNNLYVTDGVRVLKVTMSGIVSIFAGTGSVGHVDNSVGTSAQFNALNGITTDGTSLYVVDFYYYDIRKIDISTGAVSSFAGNYLTPTTTSSLDGTGINATFYQPMGISTDGTNLYVVEYWGDVVRKVVISSATATTLAGSPGLTGTTNGAGSVARFSSPMGITTYCGSLFIGDTGNGSIRRLQ